MAMFKSAENLLSSIRDAIFRLPKNNSIIIAYEHLPTAGSGTYKLRVPSNAKKAIIYPEDGSMPVTDPSVSATPAYSQSDIYTSKIILGRYQVAPAVPIPIESITTNAGIATVTLTPSSTTVTDKSNPFYTNMVVTITGSSVAGFNASWTIVNTSQNFFTFNTAVTGPATSGVVTYSSFSSINGSGAYNVAVQRDGIPFYRGEPIIIEGYDNLLNFRCVVNTGLSTGLKILYYS